MVTDVWQNTPVRGSPIERWQAKIRRLRQHLRGWAKNVSGAYKLEKTSILNKLDELDKKAEITLLTQDELNLKHVLNERLAELLREEEIKWYQRAKVKHLLEGDVNTKYYHLLANGRHRKTRIF
jgi:mannosylglycoprotein endo-beta-mannosidase